MRKLLTIAGAVLISAISFGQTTNEGEEDLNLAEKTLMKMMFKSFVAPPLTKPFDKLENEFNIQVFSSSLHKDMEMVMMCTMDLGDMDTPLEDSENLDPESITLGTLTHFSGNEIQFIQGENKEKTTKVCNYMLTYNGNTFILTYKSPIESFDKGIGTANKIAKNIKKNKN